MKSIRVGVDLGKNNFHVCATDSTGKPVWRKMLKRESWLRAMSEHVDPGCEVAMEACAGAHHWARSLRERGYQVKLIAPQFVKPYVKSNKTDTADAEAIAEAMSRPTMRFVPIKSVTQQDVQALHRVRSELIKQRTAKGNQIRGLVAEYGLVAPRNLVHLRRAIPRWLEDAQNGLTTLFRSLLSGLQEDLLRLDARIRELDAQMGAVARQDPIARRLTQLRGVGPVNATALAAALGDGSEFRNGRSFAASLGLTPRQHSTGGKERLLGISKRGDGYLRKQLVHGARAVVYHCRGKDDELSQWVNELTQRRHTNVVTVALAAKTARIAWSMVRHEMDYKPKLAARTLTTCDV